MRDLPSGTVTFLFTDIEGSTRLLKQLGDRYGQLLADHQRILRECFEAHGGREVDTQGDSFFVAFARAGDAVASAIDAQRALDRHAWPDGVQVRVRMGLHSGEPRAAGERYVGLGVHKAARVGAVAHGAQILVSSATRELVEDALPPETRLRDLGAYELRDVDRPERLYQIESEAVRSDFPPLAARRVGGPRRRRPLVIAVAVLAIAAVAASSAWLAFASEEAAAVGSAENPIRIVTTWLPEDPEHRAFEDLLTTFEETTGYETEALALDPTATTDLFATMEKVIRARVAEDDPPTLAIIPSPGIVRSLARDGIAKPLSALDISDAHIRKSYGDAWTDLATFREEAYGFPVKAGSKSLLWYRPLDLERVGVTVPKTWAELVSSTREIERAGETPWSVSAGDSWTLTDWFENLYIRTSGPWKYDALFAGKLPFDDPSVTAALKRMTTLLDDDAVAGGISGAMTTDFDASLRSVFGPEPSAHLYLEGGFVGPLVLQYLTPTPKPGKTIGAAPFPPIEPSVGGPVVVGADFIVTFEDDDAVRALLLYLSSPGAGRIWVSSGSIVSPHRGVPLRAYPNGLVRTEARQLVEAKVVRLDGSDLLPGTLASELGSTLQQVLQRPDDASELMREFQSKAARVFRQ